MRYIFFGDENFHDDIAVRLANAGFERCADVEEASAIITFWHLAIGARRRVLRRRRVRPVGASRRGAHRLLRIDARFRARARAVATVSDLGFVEAPIALEDMLDPRPFDEENLVCYVAGEEDAVAAAQGLLNAVCGRVVECGAAGTAQLMRAVRTLQEAAAVVSAIEANALVRAAHRAALGNGLSDVAISGLSEPAERMLEAVREKRFEGAFTAEMFLSELQAALASADDADLILPQAESTMHLVELLEVIGGSFKSPAALALVYGEEAECAENGLDWSRAEEAYGQGADDDDDYGYGYDDEEDDCGAGHHHDHGGFGYSAN